MEISELVKIVKILDENKSRLTRKFNAKEAEFIGNGYKFKDGKEYLYKDDQTFELKIPKDHWLGWLSEYHTNGAYNRKVISGTSAKDVYNRLLCPNMLIWISEASGVPSKLIVEATEASLKDSTHLASVCSKIRKILTWEIVEKYLDKVWIQNLRTQYQEGSLVKPKILNKKWVQTFLEIQKWQTSINPYTRHQYVWRDRIIDKSLLNELCTIAEYIHEKGEHYTWKNKVYIYLILGKYKYWVMWKTEKYFMSINRWKTFGDEIKSTRKEISDYNNQNILSLQDNVKNTKK
jgi:hypothetical protein